MLIYRNKINAWYCNQQVQEKHSAGLCLASLSPAVLDIFTIYLRFCSNGNILLFLTLCIACKVHINVLMLNGTVWLWFTPCRTWLNTINNFRCCHCIRGMF